MITPLEGIVPFPARATDAVGPLSGTVMTIDPGSAPLDKGAKATLKVQELLGGSGVGQLFDCG